ncbi:hypothetical protein GOV14_02915 [Candidatus Pacearchaeota archaeon]|nr:hypothetical protein [Candidatus Pacearchaeota archaeon]
MKNNLIDRIFGNKRGQIAIFVILGIVIVAAIVVFFVITNNPEKISVPKELEQVYTYYQSCIEQEIKQAAMILSERGGYLDNPEFVTGSTYMPFSSQLDFLGIGVPYWYYLSGNGVVHEQVPALNKIEAQLNDYLGDRISECDFDSFLAEGYQVGFGEVEVSTTVNKRSIDVEVEQDLIISFGEVVWTKGKHTIETNSNLGNFYNLARQIYSNHKSSMFLEEYGLDVLRLYAPVDGSEIGCSPKIWSVNEVHGDIVSALEANVPAIKLKGNYYDAEKVNDYFIHDIGEDVDANINFMYSRQWPMRFEVWDQEDGILRADPVGLQEGLGMLGFCYTPYHFVYDLYYPVMIQIYSDEEMFQFPVVVVIDKTNARKALQGVGMPQVVPELCEHKNTPISVSTYNTNLEPLDATIRFKCFDTTCLIGETEIVAGESILETDFPQCVNGYVIAEKEGYETKKYLVSTIAPESVYIVMDKKYNLSLEVTKGNSKLEKDYAILTFTKDDITTTVAYPNQSEVMLTPGTYEIKAYIYTNSNIRLAGSSQRKCVKVPKSGVLGFFGAEEEKCFDLDMPAQTVNLAISGGGKWNNFIGESELLESTKMIINADSFGVPQSVESLQANFNNVDISSLDIFFE